MSAIITLTTDFGLADAYVAVMKGVILGINPEARLVDICHVIGSQNVAQAAFVLGNAHRFFPGGTVHLVVVDPGVGSQRRAVILRTPSADFVAPDNGVLSYLLPETACRDVAASDTGQPRRALGPGLEAVAITNQEFWRSPVSPTFHGRDIFAPVAAHLSLGRSLGDFGESIASLVTLPLSRPCQAADGSVTGHILHIDAFGNLITDITGQDVPSLDQDLVVEVAGCSINHLSHTYSEAPRGQPLALFGSSGYLEVSVNLGSAHSLLGVGIGDQVKVRPLTGGQP